MAEIDFESVRFESVRFESVRFESVREAPAPQAIESTDPSHPDVPQETVLNVTNIQGDILAGFNKDFQTLLFLEISEIGSFRTWLGRLVPFIATADEVLAFNKLFKAVRSRRGIETGVVRSTWISIAFTYAGIRKFSGEIESLLDPDFTSDAFKAGMAARAAQLGDPMEQNGRPANWVVGADARLDAVILVASDTQDDLDAELHRLLGRDSEQGAPPHDQSLYRLQGATVIWREDGRDLPGDLAGHEHFGFLDGVSQPGLRGRISALEHDVLTPRQNPGNRNQGKPGQDLLWPGAFVIGYPGQTPNPDNSPDITVEQPGPVSSAGPDWAVDGSFLVIRRLYQNVGGFHTFLKEEAAKRNLPPALLGAKLVGRWPSGAPILRAPLQDAPDLAANDCANNHFEFQEESEAIPSPESPFDCRDNRYPPAPADREGMRCPFAGHIRKTYPRDDETDRRPFPNEAETQTHRLLRRGIPYGPPSESRLDAPKLDTVDRGLLFLAYQSSIEGQFEFVTRNWANNRDFKEPSDGGPLRSGYDPIIGQNATPGENRKRHFVVTFEGRAPETLETEHDWVIPTGGGYFFAPSIDALRRLAGTTNDTPGER